MLVKLLRGMTFGSTAALGLAIVAPVAAHAQAQTAGTRFGVEAAYADHFNLGVGAFVKFHLAELSGHPITGRASFDYYFPGSYNYCALDACDVKQHYFQISADGLYDISSKGNVKPYVGAGLVYSHYSIGNSDNCPGCDFGSGGVGLDIMGGLNFMANSKLMPFVEAKLGLGGSVGAYGSGEFVLKGGIHF
ncbi:MAG TPA: hypothetical protein VGM20_12690 [Gemmatimonadales bacterium]|jgi:hypothetical protein